MKKILGITLSSILIIIFILQIALVNYAKQKYTNPIYHVTPTIKEIKPLSPSTNPSQNISYSGLNFTVPWGDKATIKKFQAIESQQYTNERIILSKIEINNTPSINDNSEVGKFERTNELLFGKEIADSNYEFTKLIMESTPEKMSILSSILEDTRNIYSIEMKISRPRLTLYNFDNGKIKGFQYGSPKIDSEVDLNIYKTDNDAYSILIKGKNINQDDIDYIISSAHF